MRAFFDLLKGVRHMSFLNQILTLVLTVVNFAIPLLFVNVLEAQVALGVFLVNIIAMTSLTALTGYTRLVSIGHALWFPLIYFFWIRLGAFPADTFFGIWMRALILINSGALLIDMVNIWLYLRGDRKIWVR